MLLEVTIEAQGHSRMAKEMTYNLFPFVEGSIPFENYLYTV